MIGKTNNKQGSAPKGAPPDALDAAMRRDDVPDETIDDLCSARAHKQQSSRPRDAGTNQGDGVFL